MNAMQKRDRGRLLTPEALTKLQQAIRDWEVRYEKKCTQERIKELTGEFKEGGLDPGTISKILKSKEGVDLESIRCLLRTFGLQLAETDLVAAIAFAAQSDPNFVGREGAIAELKTLTDRGTKVIVIQARGGVGKTTLARKYLQQEFGTFLEFPIAKETKDIASVESLIEEKLRQLGEEPGREFLVSIDRLKRKLQSERIGILIDNLEPALDSAGKLIEAHRRYVELLRVLADPTVRSVTLITTRERLRESSITVQHYLLRSLDVTAWETYFQSRNIVTDGSALSALHNAYGGNAKAMDILSGAIAEDFSGDIAAYWQMNQGDLLIDRDLEDLVTTQFNRTQELDENAYNLLCRMGCYRYQDVPRVPIEGLLCLLWDVAEGQRRRVIKTLQDRSLVDCQDGEYWLHPVIRGEAIGRLRVGEIWDEANRKAAEFWTKNVEVIEDLNDALNALEACYHYIEIKDFSFASDVLVQERGKVLHEFENLGLSLCRLGLLQQAFSVINNIINVLEPGYPLGKIYHILGDLHMLKGNIRMAILYYDEAKKMTTKILEEIEDDELRFKLTKCQISSFFSSSLCKVELWELEDAIDIIRETELMDDCGIKFFAQQNRLCCKGYLAFLYSQLGDLAKAAIFIDDIINELPEARLNIWIKGYVLLNLGRAYSNLGKHKESFDAYTKVLTYTEECNFLQIKALAFNGIAKLFKESRHFQEAIDMHTQALEILNSLGDKCELAEVYYQFGLTYQAMGENNKSNKKFQEAIQLFTEIEAPKRVERVRRSLEN